MILAFDGLGGLKIFFLVFEPDFFGEVFIAAAVQVSDALFNQVGRLGVVEDIGRLLERNMIHLADTGDDSCVLFTPQYLF